MTQYDLIKHLSWHQCFSLILIGCGVPVYFYLGFHLPIFTDEVAWKIASSRYQVDQGLSVSLLPLCSAKAFLTKVPSVFVPAALLESFLYQDLSNLIKLRWYGSISLALFFLSVFVLCYIVNLGHRPHSILNSFITS
ncbi:hypothetical protein EBQ90_00135, partial [bacterium]|nr:hypothetical protein [bacterium]